MRIMLATPTLVGSPQFRRDPSCLARWRMPRSVSHASASPQRDKPATATTWSSGSGSLALTIAMLQWLTGETCDFGWLRVRGLVDKPSPKILIPDMLSIPVWFPWLHLNPGSPNHPMDPIEGQRLKSPARELEWDGLLLVILWDDRTKRYIEWTDKLTKSAYELNLFIFSYRISKLTFSSNPQKIWYKIYPIYASKDPDEEWSWDPVYETCVGKMCEMQQWKTKSFHHSSVLFHQTLLTFHEFQKTSGWPGGSWKDPWIWMQVCWGISQNMFFDMSSKSVGSSEVLVH